MEVIKDYHRLFPNVLEKAYERSKSLRKVDDIMSRDIVTIGKEATMDEAARIMGEKHIGSLIVEIDGEPVGIVTERDLLSRVIAKGLDPKNVKVSRVTSSPLITLKPSLSIKKAAQTMIKKKGRLAVFDAGKLVGIITASDLVRSLPESPETVLKVDDYMTREVITSDEGTTVISLARLMGERRIGSVVITRGGEPVGIFTERDLLTTFLARSRSMEVEVGEVCSSPLVAISSGMSIHEAATIMAARRLKRLPIVENSRLIGIITARDLVKAYSK